MEIEAEYKKALELISQSSTILLTMHERMDGDDGGSLLAMAMQLESRGKLTTLAIKKGVPESLAFLPESGKIQDDIEGNEQFDLLITFGCSNIQRTGSEKIQQLKTFNPELKLLNIDHHPDNAMYGDVNLVDAQKSSVAELVYEMFVFLKWPIDKAIATCLLTGIISDTGSFMHSNTQSSTLEAAANLMRKGALSAKIIGNTYKNKTSPVLKAWAKAMENCYFDQKQQMITCVIGEQDLNELGNLPQAAFDGIAETLAAVPEAKFSMFLRQDNQVVKGSLRSEKHKGADVQQIAKMFGGGGHKLAAGFSLPGKLVKDQQGRWKIV